MRLCLVCFSVTERQCDFCRLQLLQLRMKWSGKTLSGFSCSYIPWLSVMTCVCTCWNQNCCHRGDLTLLARSDSTLFSTRRRWKTGHRWRRCPSTDWSHSILLTLSPLWHSLDSQGNLGAQHSLSNIKIPIDGLILLGRFMNINLSQVSFYRSGLSSQVEELTVSYLEQNKGSWIIQNKEMETCQLTRTGEFVSASWRHTVHIQCEALSITEDIKMRGMLLTTALCQGRVMMPCFLFCFERLAFWLSASLFCCNSVDIND